MGKKSGSGSGMNNPDHITESLKQFFGLKYLNSLMQILDGKFGSGIRDKHSGSATLLPIKIVIIELSFAACCQSTSSGAPDDSRTTTPPSAAIMSGSTRCRPGAVRPAIRLVSLFLFSWGFT
jgi:hypothetical protein